MAVGSPAMKIVLGEARYESFEGVKAYEFVYDETYVAYVAVYEY